MFYFYLNINIIYIALHPCIKKNYKKIKNLNKTKKPLHKALITLPSTKRDEFMPTVSFNVFPLTLLFFIRSLPIYLLLFFYLYYFIIIIIIIINY
jgi:hypothetical protein